MLILACQAGKDVYVEKPVFYRVGEAKAMIEPSEATSGSFRSAPSTAPRHMAEAARIVAGRQRSRVHFVRVWNFMGTGYGQPARSDAPPAARP